MARPPKIIIIEKNTHTDRVVEKPVYIERTRQIESQPSSEKSEAAIAMVVYGILFLLAIGVGFFLYQHTWAKWVFWAGGIFFFFGLVYAISEHNKC